MKKQITGVVAALLTSAVFTVSASAEYYIDTKQDGNTVKAEVIANGATLPAMEFTVKLPDGINADSVNTIDGSVYNEEKGHFAWAGINAPADGTVMYSVTFTVKDGDEGSLTITPIEGYEADMPKALTADFSAKDTDTSDSNTSSDGGETSDTTNEPDDNPNTGIVLSLAAVGVVGAAVVVSAKRKKK